MTGQNAMETPKIERLYLDFDSFFATAEQHFNPALRGKPVGVVPLDSAHTGCLAISREAKARGVKSGATIKGARQQVPDMIFVVARHDVYVRLHNRILEVIEQCLPIADVRSIDEVVCHLLPSEAQEGAALARRIKTALAKNFSPVLTCSIGMAATELLAKVGAEMDKPDGFTLIDNSDLPTCLERLELNDLPGISKGMEKRLNGAGVANIAALWRLAPKQARAIWGSVEGERFWNEFHGLHSQRSGTVKRMFGHSRMLPLDWRTPDKIRDCAQQLTTSACRRLRRADLRATKLSLGYRGGGYRSGTGSKKDDLRWHWEKSVLPARDDHTFLSVLKEGLSAAQSQVDFKPRSVSVMLHGLVGDDEITGDLFGDLSACGDRGSVKEDQKRWEDVSDVLDELREVHGPEVISLGPHSEVPGGYLGAKIAFARIPDIADFGKAQVADDATHFCSF